MTDEQINAAIAEVYSQNLGVEAMKRLIRKLQLEYSWKVKNAHDRGN